MHHIRPANAQDLSRIAEILIFNYRLHFYPIFRNDEFYFGELQVSTWMQAHQAETDHIWVYDDGVVKGFVQIEGREIQRLFVEPALQSQSIGSCLLRYAVDNHHANTLWALEKNTRAIAFYQRHGFRKTMDRKTEEDTTEYLIRLER